MKDTLNMVRFTTAEIEFVVITPVRRCSIATIKTIRMKVSWG